MHIDIPTYMLSGRREKSFLLFEYRKIEFQTTSEDRPLVAHFSANDPRTFLAAAKLVESKCDAIGKNKNTLQFCIATAVAILLLE